MNYTEFLIACSIRRFPKESWYRWADRLEGSDKIIRANFMRPRTTPIDVQADDMGVEIQDIVDFVYKYRYIPPNPTYDDPIDYGQSPEDLLPLQS